jgi:hypothetical protein
VIGGDVDESRSYQKMKSPKSALHRVLGHL